MRFIIVKTANYALTVNGWVAYVCYVNIYHMQKWMDGSLNIIGSCRAICFGCSQNFHHSNRCCMPSYSDYAFRMAHVCLVQIIVPTEPLYVTTQCEYQYGRVDVCGYWKRSADSQEGKENPKCVMAKWFALNSSSAFQPWKEPLFQFNEAHFRKLTFCCLLIKFRFHNSSINSERIFVFPKISNLSLEKPFI